MMDEDTMSIKQTLIAIQHGRNASDSEKETADRAHKALSMGEFDRSARILRSGGFNDLSRRVLDTAHTSVSNEEELMQFTHYNQPYGYVTFEVEQQEPCNYNVCAVFRGSSVGYVPREKCCRHNPDHVPHPVGSKCVPYREGWIRLEGTVVKGSETSRLFHHTHTRDLKGTHYALEVSPEDLAKGEKTTVACG